MPNAVSLPLATGPDADPLSSAASRAEHDRQRVVLTRNDKPVAAVVPIENLDALEALEAQEDEHWSHVAEAAIETWDADGRPPGVSHEELLARYGIASERE